MDESTILVRLWCVHDREDPDLFTAFSRVKLWYQLILTSFQPILRVFINRNKLTSRRQS